MIYGTNIEIIFEFTSAKPIYWANMGKVWRDVQPKYTNS